MYFVLFRLQYFARGCQTYHSQLQAALKGKNALELKEEQVCLPVCVGVCVCKYVPALVCV